MLRSCARLSRLSQVLPFVLAVAAAAPPPAAAQQTRQVPVESLIYDLKNPDPVRRREAATLIGQNRIQRATPDLLPLATDVPRVDLVHLETPSPLNPLGVKGAGEGGTIPAIAAIVSAVEHALEPFGVRIAEAPITPQRIVELLGEHALGRTRYGLAR